MEKHLSLCTIFWHKYLTWIFVIELKLINSNTKRKRLSLSLHVLSMFIIRVHFNLVTLFLKLEALVTPFLKLEALVTLFLKLVCLTSDSLTTFASNNPLMMSSVHSPCKGPVWSHMAAFPVRTTHVGRLKLSKQLDSNTMQISFKTYKIRQVLIMWAISLNSRPLSLHFYSNISSGEQSPKFQM